MATLTLVRKSIYRLCSEAAYDQGLPFYQTTKASYTQALIGS